MPSQAGDVATRNRLYEQHLAHAELFRISYSAVWTQIPRKNREVLLQHWRNESACSREGDRRFWPGVKPWILLTGADSESADSPVWESNAVKLVFPMRVIVEQPASLTLMLATFMAHAYRCATGEYWGDQVRMLLDPYDRWEESQAGDITERYRDMRWDKLHDRFKKCTDKAVAGLLSSWGFAG